MGNSSSKDARPPSRPGSIRRGSSAQAAAAQASQGSQPLPTPGERLTGQAFSSRNTGGRGSRPDLSFLGLGRDRDNEGGQASERPRETKQERDARKAEKERVAREKERERSMQEEGVDGGYLVTLGTYTGPEDFSKPIVRQLQIERKLAPFWKGLNDHSGSWAEHQLVAAARGLPIPAADEAPVEISRTESQASNKPQASESMLNKLTVPIDSRSQSYQSDASGHLSPSLPALSSSGPASSSAATSNNPLFRGRAKTLASLTTGSKSQSPDLTPQEMRLSHEPNYNGQPIEAYLYKDASECPICFLFYPPYLNKTRCCDQAICSECFVQIKRPDPHPPEHEQPGQQRPPEEEADLLVSEIASCPFCVTPEFGVTYEPPPFRRGLAYANQGRRNPLQDATSEMSSSTSLQSTSQRRRTTSISATAPQVITTDRVRPDWAKKLSDARAHALRRSAAATALHNAAYVLGSNGEPQSRGTFGRSRRRRALFSDSPSASGSGTPRFNEGMNTSTTGGTLDQADRRQGGEGEGQNLAARRRNRVEDLEDLMMMEAIRLSLAAEEDRTRKDTKANLKAEKKREKEARKEGKKADKIARKHGGSSSSLYQTGTNDGPSTYDSTPMARSTSNLGSHQPAIPEEQIQGKGKAPVQDFAGFNPIAEPSSTLNNVIKDDDSGKSSSASGIREDPQRHLETQRANLQPTASSPVLAPTGNRPAHLRELSNASSTASSFVDSAPNSLRADSNMPSASGSGLDLPSPAAQTENNTSSQTGTPPPGSAGSDSMFNFRSLAAMIGEESEKAGRGSEHIENSISGQESADAHPEAPRLSSPASEIVEGNRSRGDSGESSSSAPPPIYVEASPGLHGGGEKTADGDANGDAGVDAISAVPPHTEARVVHGVDSKHVGDVEVVDRGEVRREAAQ